MFSLFKSYVCCNDISDLQCYKGERGKNTLEAKEMFSSVYVNRVITYIFCKYYLKIFIKCLKDFKYFKNIGELK